MFFCFVVINCCTGEERCQSWSRSHSKVRRTISRRYAFGKVYHNSLATKIIVKSMTEAVLHSKTIFFSIFLCSAYTTEFAANLATTAFKRLQNVPLQSHERAVCRH